MDNTVIFRQEGFADQRISRLPAATARLCDRSPVIRGLYPESIGHFPYAPGHRVERPAGIDNQLVILCTAGLGYLEIHGTRHDIRPGQIALVPRSTPHRYGASLQKPWGKYWTHFNGNEADALMQKLQVNPGTCVYDLPETGEATACFDELYHWALQTHTPETLLQIHGALLRWLLCILRLRGQTGARARRSDEGILKILREMQRDCRPDYRPGDLAQACGMSEAAFYRGFKRQAGCTPVQFLTRVRMQRACQLLDLSDDPISEIGRQVGYDDAYYFSRVFSRTLGLSPSAYRHSDIGAPKPARPRNQPAGS